jgi:succinate-acetate transporter protein
MRAMSAVTKTGNPAVVGLAGFGLTTLLLQLHNLGLCGSGPVLAMGLVFGGMCQLIAGLQEQKVGNNFGYSAFVSYGAFWIGLGLLWIAKAFKFEPFVASHTDVGWFLVAWTGYSAILWVASFRVHKAMAITFTLLMAGFVLLDIGHFGPAVCNTAAAYVLIACALMAWYMMGAVILNDQAGGVVLPLGSPWIGRRG